MSLPSNKPYKSRLFNFLNRYYIKFNSQVNIKFRELGYVAKTGLQSLVLPLFWLWETTKKISQTFSPTSSSVSSQLKDSSQTKALVCADDVIKSVNEVINFHPQLTSFPIKNFQGFASRIKDKHIICILENNKFTDIIPVDKQEEVNIIIHNITDKLTNIQRLPRVLPSNFFSRFLPWFNIFRKSKINVNISQDMNNLNTSDLVFKNQSSSGLFLAEKNQIIYLIDSFFAILEKITFLSNPKTLEDGQNILNTEGEIISSENQDNHIVNNSQTLNSDYQKKLSIFFLIQEAINYFFREKNNQNQLTENNYSINNKLSSRNKNNLSLPAENITNNNPIQNIIIQAQYNLENIIPLVQDSTEQIISQGLNQLNFAKNNLYNKLNNSDDPFQVKMLIWAAIDYFFYNKTQLNKLSSNNHNLASFSETEIIIINEEIADPWLSWEDLFGNNILPDSSINNNFNIIIEDKQFNEEITANFEDEVLESTSELVELIINNREIEQIKKTKNNQKSVVIQDKQTVKVEKKEIILEEIEVQIMEIKYEKHLLEIILEKLDQFILWLEEIMVKIVKKIKLLIEK